MLDDWRAARAVARRRLAASRPVPVRSWQAPNTELTRYLRNKPGRCPCCVRHIGTQGHAPGCLVGPRANMALNADGSWTRNPLDG